MKQTTVTSLSLHRILPFVLTAVLAGVLSATADAQQRVPYRALMMQSQGQPIHMDAFTLPGGPGETDSSLLFALTFKIPHSGLPFRKTDRSNNRAEFYSPASLSIEMFRGTAKDLEEPRRVEVAGREAIGRATWADTAWAVNYEQTRSEADYLEGSLTLDLQPGIYVYVVQMARGVDADDRTSRALAFEIKAYDLQQHGDVLLGDRSAEAGGSDFPLLNIGNSVPYAADFDALIHLQDHNEGDRYRVTVDRVQVDREDTTFKSTVWESDIASSDIRSGVTPSLDLQSIAINLVPGSRTYALVHVPNERFPNDMYRMTVTRDGSGEVVARRVYRSLWRDMPASLLNLDVAIEMLRFIVDDGTIREIRRGSSSETERKFREFWNAKDPTPDTEYNELMAEYYRRIDHAYREYSTQENPGYDTDQGKIYIQFGEPQKVERSFPTGEPTTEIWIYPNRRFVFRATSGFGDFKLVNG